MTNILIGLKVKELREKANLSQAQIARFLGVDQSTISKCEKGERQFQVDHLEQLGNLFGFTLADLIDEKSQNNALRIAFRADDIQIEDLTAIADIHKIALNLNQMRNLLQESLREA